MQVSSTQIDSTQISSMQLNDPLASLYKTGFMQFLSTLLS
jgi:hypothetical protein